MAFRSGRTLRSQSNSTYDDLDDLEDSRPLLDRPRLSNSSNRPKPTLGHTGLPHPDKRLLQPVHQQRILWGRTFLIAFAWMIITMLACLVAMFVNAFIALGVGTVMVVLSTCMPNMCLRAYDEVRAPNNHEWSSTLRWTVVGSAFMAVLAAGGFGFFYRVVYRADAGHQYELADPTTAPRVTPIGTIKKWKDDGVVARQYVGRAVSMGVWPVCVVPILDKDAVTTLVNYWAVESGKCCAASPPSCSSWKPDAANAKTVGGIGLYYREMYGNVEQAVADSLKNAAGMGLHASPNAVFVVYGDPVSMKKNLTWTATTILSIVGGVAILYIFVKARWGIYERVV